MPLDLVLMRGGTSRGPVLRSELLPVEPTERDEILVRLLAGSDPQLGGLGGGTPTTSKVAVVATPDPKGAANVVDFAVGNLVMGTDVLDWEGTCGNMTAAVALYAFEEGLAPEGTSVVLRNRSTDGLIEAELQRPRASHRRGDAAVIRTTYRDPGGTVLGSVLPTGSPMDTLDVDGTSYECTVIDVAHPYLFLRYSAVGGEVARHIERIRGAACVRLGLSSTIDEAMAVSPAVPRVVLVREGRGAGGQVQIAALSMGQQIDTVPVTAAMCLAAACAIPGTVVHLGEHPGGQAPRLRTSPVVVSAAGATVTASAEIGAGGHIRSTSVERTAQTLLRGTAWP